MFCTKDPKQTEERKEEAMEMGQLEGADPGDLQEMGQTS